MKSLPHFFIALAAVLLTHTAAAQNQLEPAKGNQAATKPKAADVKVVDVPGLPRVLLIGDSISYGYQPFVTAKLKGKANIHHPPENCGHTGRGLAYLDKWLAGEHWDVIHFNFGLHDLKYLDEKGNYVTPDKGKQVTPPEIYRQQLTEVTKRLQATGAKLVFATTTPVPPGARGRVAGDEIVYNKIAREVMQALNVPVDDLGAYVAEQQKKLPPYPVSERAKARDLARSPRPGEIQNPFDVHFTPEGYKQLADLVVASVEKVLPASH